MCLTTIPGAFGGRCSSPTRDSSCYRHPRASSSESDSPSIRPSRSVSIRQWTGVSARGLPRGAAEPYRLAVTPIFPIASPSSTTVISAVAIAASSSTMAVASPEAIAPALMPAPLVKPLPIEVSMDVDATATVAGGTEMDAEGTTAKATWQPTMVLHTATTDQRMATGQQITLRQPRTTELPAPATGRQPRTTGHPLLAMEPQPQITELRAQPAERRLPTAAWRPLTGERPLPITARLPQTAEPQPPATERRLPTVQRPPLTVARPLTTQRQLLTVERQPPAPIGDQRQPTTRHPQVIPLRQAKARGSEGRSC